MLKTSLVLKEQRFGQNRISIRKIEFSNQCQKSFFSEKVSIWLLEVPRGVSNNSGGQLGPPEVIFDLLKKIDFLKFFGFFKIFCPLELVCKISVFGPQTHQKWIKPARPNTF